MKISYLSCDVCGYKAKNAFEHEHRELEIGGVPMNIWTAVYSLPTSLKSNQYSKGIMKFRDYIPFEIGNSISDKEGSTSLKKLEENVFLKDESQNPTGSFKDRGSVMLISDALLSNKKKVAIPSTGNAAISLGYYAERAGLESIIFVPEDISKSKKSKIESRSTVIYNKDLIKSYEKFFEFCRSNASVYNGFPVINLPYLQGLKTMAYEIFLQIGTPDWIVIPIGSGCNITAQYQGFKDINVMGLSNKLPRFIGVQIEGADPITQGYNKKQYGRVVILNEPVESKAKAIASDTCFNYFKIMNILKKTKGFAISVTDDEIERTKQAPWLEFSSKSVFPALNKIKDVIKKEDVMVLIGTASIGGDSYEKI